MPVKVETKVVEKLVPVQVPADSASIQALFRSDSAGGVVMAQIAEQKSAHVSSRVSFNNGVLSYKAKTVHDTVWLPAKDSIVYKDKPILQPYPVETNRLTWWQKFFVYSGRVAWLIVIAIILFIITKQFLKFK